VVTLYCFHKFNLFEIFGLNEQSFIAYLEAVALAMHPNPYHNHVRTHPHDPRHILCTCVKLNLASYHLPGTFYHLTPGTPIKLRPCATRSLRSCRFNNPPAHTQVHAADVVQRTATILQHEIYPAVIDDLQLMAALIAALIHDLGHPGLSNTFHIVDGNKMARTFNDNHVLENHALFTGMELWREDSLNFFHRSRVGASKQLELRSTVIKMVLATDMAGGVFTPQTPPTYPQGPPTHPQVPLKHPLNTP